MLSAGSPVITLHEHEHWFDAIALLRGTVRRP
jgi:hypothetical protein